MFERGNPYGKTDPTGHVFLAVNSPALLGVSNLGLLLGETEAAYIPESEELNPLFEDGEVNNILRESGYKESSELTKGSWLRDLLGKFSSGGMGKMNPDGTADVVRWDPGHSGYDYPHMNHVKYGLDSTGKIVKLGTLPLDHVGYFFFPMSFAPKSSQTDVAKKVSGGSSGKCNVDMSCKGKGSGSGSGGSSKSDGTDVGNGGVCGKNMSCK